MNILRDKEDVLMSDMQFTALMSLANLVISAMTLLCVVAVIVFK